MKNFATFADAGGYKALLQQALEIKANPYGYQHIGRNKTIGLIFFNHSLRTRLSPLLARVCDALPLGCEPVARA